MFCINPKDLISQLEWRYATKIFDTSKKIPSQEWQALTQSLLLSPSSYGLQPWKFLQIENPEIRKKLRSVSWNQAQVEEASQFVVFCYLKNLDETYVQKFITRMAKLRQQEISSMKDYEALMTANVAKGGQVKDQTNWAIRQVYIALGFLLNSAAFLGIDSCPMEGIDPEQYDQILNLQNTPYRSVAACALGYRSPNDKYALAKKVRFEASELIEVI